jgi:hypothetical protein
MVWIPDGWILTCAALRMRYMPMKLPAWGLCVLVITLLLWVTGCAYNQRLKVTPMEPLPEPDKLPLRATLVLSEQFCSRTYKVDQSRSLRTWVYRMGKTLCAHAENVARDSFSEVVVAKEETTSAGQDTDVVVTPRLIAVLVDFPDFPQSIWAEQEVEIILEWTITDRTGKLLWTHTDGGISRLRAGSFLTRARLNRLAMQRAVDEVFRKFRGLIVSSQELHTLAAALR